MNIPDDVRSFLEGYPGASNKTSLDANLRFYKNEGRCRPDNLLVEQLQDECVTRLLIPILSLTSIAKLGNCI